MNEETVAELVAKTLAHTARRSSIPAFIRIAFADDAIAIETIDGRFFELRVSEVDGIEFPQGEAM